MNATQKIAAGLVSIVALGTFAFAPVGADTPERLASHGAAPVVALNHAETRQEFTWDMTSGELSPPVFAAEAPTQEATAEEVTDLSMG